MTRLDSMSHVLIWQDSRGVIVNVELPRLQTGVWGRSMTY
jgi:hypothetical protein